LVHVLVSWEKGENAPRRPTPAVTGKEANAFLRKEVGTLSKKRS